MMTFNQQDKPEITRISTPMSQLILKLSCNFYVSNSVPESSSNKRLKLQFQDISNSSKHDSTPEIPITIHNQSNYNSISFIDEDEPVSSTSTNYNTQNIYRVPPHISDQITSFQKTLSKRQ